MNIGEVKLIYREKPETDEYLYDERTGGWTDYNDFRVYDKETNTVYESQKIASEVSGIPIKKIQNDIATTTKRWNRIGCAFYDRKYNYYNCEENFVKHRGRKKKSEE